MLYPGDRIARVTGWRYVWASLNVPSISWLQFLAMLVLGNALLSLLGWRS